MYVLKFKSRCRLYLVNLRQNVYDRSCFWYDDAISDDGVYMETGELLNEYILNECGCLFRGDAYNIDALDWNFGQVLKFKSDKYIIYILEWRS